MSLLVINVYYQHAPLANLAHRSFFIIPEPVVEVRVWTRDKIVLSLTHTYPLYYSA